MFLCFLLTRQSFSVSFSVCVCVCVCDWFLVLPGFNCSSSYLGSITVWLSAFLLSQDVRYTFWIASCPFCISRLSRLCKKTRVLVLLHHIRPGLHSGLTVETKSRPLTINLSNIMHVGRRASRHYQHRRTNWRYESCDSQLRVNLDINTARVLPVRCHWTQLLTFWHRNYFFFNFSTPCI